jgi:hypothetical protein
LPASIVDGFSNHGNRGVVEKGVGARLLVGLRSTHLIEKFEELAPKHLVFRIVEV